MSKSSEIQTFIVSGAASGIGKQIALALAKRGQRLMLLDINEDALLAALKEHGLEGSPTIIARKHDVRDCAGWERVVTETVERFGALDVMLNIAGYLKPGYIHETDPSELDKQIDINVKGVMYATRAGARQMLQQKRGHIVNIASIAGISHVPGMSAYCASKHAVRGFTLSVAHELAAHGVQVSVLCPDAVETPMLHAQTSYEEASMTFGAGRGLSLEEIEAALFQVLKTKPLELIVPVPGSGRAALAKLGNAFPPLVKLGIDRVRTQGRKVQQRRGA